METKIRKSKKTVSKENVSVSTDDSLIHKGEDVSAINEKEAERANIQTQIEAFLNQGGTIQHIANNVMADPPKKPTSNYGGQPI